MNYVPVKLKKSHSLIGQICYICRKPFDTLQSICLVPLCFNAEESCVEAAKQGKMQNGLPIPLHYSCAE